MSSYWRARKAANHQIATLAIGEADPGSGRTAVAQNRTRRAASSRRKADVYDLAVAKGMATHRTMMARFGIVAATVYCLITLGICAFWIMFAFMPGPDADSSRSQFHHAPHLPFVLPPIYAISAAVGWFIVIGLDANDEAKPRWLLLMIAVAAATYPLVRWAWAS
jgi:hypothetical protein